MASFLHIFDGLVHDCRAGHFDSFPDRRNEPIGSQEIERILVSCILSSGWVYEKALVASVLFGEYFHGVERSSVVPGEAEIEHFLRGRDVRHRFPKTRAMQLHSSLEALRALPLPFCDFVAGFDSEFAAREFLVQHFPGLGYKQSSMFLRDVGVSHELAVIDVHILWYMENVENLKIKTVGKGMYVEIERYIRELSKKVEISMNMLDRLIWVAVREFRKLKRVNSCGMQYALPLGD